MLLLIDNYDSFTYNLVQYFQSLNEEVYTVTHDCLSIEDVRCLSPKRIVISPGPKDPEAAGLSLDIIRHFHQTIPILGVCLGHQCLAYEFGGKIITAPEIMHGKTSLIHHNRQKLFKNVPSPFTAMRYHSLVADVETLPDCFAIDAFAGDVIMAISHRVYPLFGLQFHPESILSEHGLQILDNFIQYEHTISAGKFD